MPSETDVAPKAISGWMDWMGLEITRQGYAKSTFGAKNDRRNSGGTLRQKEKKEKKAAAEAAAEEAV